LNARDSAAHVKPKNIPALFYVATQKNGTVYLKIVNAQNVPQAVNLSLQGAGKVALTGTKVVLKSDNPEDTNSITEPEKIIPVTTKIKGIKKAFSQTLPAYSITILQLETK
ncbi:MAG: alpha-N-arabinofuranosidase, partial [Sphingobacteriaceae bacterium]